MNWGLRGSNPVFSCRPICKHCWKTRGAPPVTRSWETGANLAFPATNYWHRSRPLCCPWLESCRWWCKMNKLWWVSVQDSSFQPIKPKQSMPGDLLWIPARKIQQALSMMSKADSCQAACYLKHGSMRSMIAGACTCLGSVARDTRHLTRDPLLSTRSPSDYLKKPAGSWGNGSLTQCHTNMPHSHSPSEGCPAVTMHVSAPWKIFSIPAWTTWIIILATASAKLDFHNVLGKSSKIRSLPAGCRSIYWSVWGVYASQ